MSELLEGKQAPERIYGVSQSQFSIARYYFGVAEFVGTELDEDYYKACCERFENATAQGALF